MTIERAAEVVSNLSGDAKMDLFDYFVKKFNLIEQGPCEMFATMCGYMLISAVVPVVDHDYLDQLGNEFDADQFNRGIE